MNIFSLLGAAAVVAGASLPVALRLDTDPDRGTPPNAILVANKGEVIADFSVVEYYPTLKSKLGLASNIKRVDLVDAAPYLDALGPGLVCSNIEFDYWYKSPGEPIPALQQTFALSGDSKGRPVTMADTPGEWLTGYQRLVGDLNVAQLLQLTGAPAQFQQPTAAKPAIHPAPTDPAAAASLIGSWTAAAKHPYPVLWSLWNEPGHTLVGPKPPSDAAQTAPTDSGKKGDRKAAKQDAKAAKREARSGKAGKAALASERSESADEIAHIFALYSAAMRPAMNRWSQFGLASFISPDFNPDRTADTGKVYFDEVMDSLDPKVPVNFLSFNSFGGDWSLILNGVRVASGINADRGPMIFTQFAPKSMKINDDGAPTKESEIEASRMEVALETIDDFVQLQRATDVQHVCMSYWIGGENGFLDSRGNSLTPTPRFAAMQMLSALPVVRTRLDFGTTGLEGKGVRGLAGRNQGKVAVLLWNQGTSKVSVPLTLAGMPSGVEAGTATITRLDDANPKPIETAYDGGPINLPAYGMALIELANPQVSDPLLRRDAINGGDNKTRFLQTRSFTDRQSETCKPGLALPGIEGCAKNTGTYGFYDSVRSVAYLGMGNGKNAARVTATYSGLPERLYLTSQFFSVGSAAPQEALGISASFTGCDLVVEAAPSSAEGPNQTLDFQSVPADCRAKAATITLTLGGVPAGTQAEVYLSSDEAEANSIASANQDLIRADAPDMAEGLTVVKSGKADN